MGINLYGCTALRIFPSTMACVQIPYTLTTNILSDAVFRLLTSFVWSCDPPYLQRSPLGTRLLEVHLWFRQGLVCSSTSLTNRSANFGSV